MRVINCFLLCSIAIRNEIKIAKEIDSKQIQKQKSTFAGIFEKL